MSDGNIKFTYFEIRGLGEVARLILHYAGVKFEDKRIEFKDWDKFKDRCDDFEAAEADEMYNFMYDRIREHSSYSRLVYKNDETNKQKLYDEAFVPAAHKALATYDRAIRAHDSGYILASGLSYADFTVAEHAKTLFELEPKFRQSHEKLALYVEKIHAHPKIVDYIASRPATKI